MTVCFSSIELKKSSIPLCFGGGCEFEAATGELAVFEVDAAVLAGLDAG
jgi:hypothetical protein